VYNSERLDQAVSYFSIREFEPMKRTPQRKLDRTPSQMTPPERLSWLARLSPMRRRMPRSILFVGTGIVVAILLIIFIAVLVSDQASAVIEVWIERMTKNY
jgi:hypothetical protein